MLQIDKDHKNPRKYKAAAYDYGEEPYEEGEIGEKMKSQSSSPSSSEIEPEMMNAEVSVEDSTAQEARHECNLCGKSFNSGKALGGHRRSHFYAAKKKQSKNPNFSNHSKQGTIGNNNNRDICYNDGGENDGKQICYVCNKKFPTKNALYGHMRSHPDRVCKGISPPSTHHHHHDDQHHHNNCSSTSHNSNSSMEHNKEEEEEEKDDVFVAPSRHISKSLLPRWKKKDKRGRKCTEGYVATYEGAINLMYLGDTMCSLFAVSSIKKDTITTTTAVVEPKSLEIVPKPSKKRKIGESSTGKEHGVKKVNFVFNRSPKEQASAVTQHDVSVSSTNQKLEICIPKLGSKIDGVGGVSDCDSDKLKGSKRLSKSSGLKKISVNMDVMEEEEKPLGGEEITLTASQFAGSKKLDFDLNEPYVMEDE